MRFLTYTLLLIIGIVLFSCSGGPYRQSLLDIDSICSANPNRAISMLDSMKGEMSVAPKREQMYYRLLRIKANDKAYIPHESDTAILPLIEYYEKHGNDKQLSETYYYAGSVYRDLNDAPMALEYFQKALDCMPEDDNLKLHSKTYYQMAELFLYQKLYDKSIDFYKQACSYDSVDNDTAGVVYCLQSIGYLYDCKNLKDSSIIYYKRALDLANNSNNKTLERFVTGQMTTFYINNKEYKKAKECLLPVLYEDTVNQSSHYSMASDIYMGLGQYDSTKYYCDKLLKIGTVSAKMMACEKLVKIYSYEKSYDEMIRYFESYSNYNDSVSNMTATESVARMDAMYNYQIREKENLQLKAERLRYLLYILLMAVAFGLFVLMFVYYREMSKKKRKQLELQIYIIKQIERERFEQSEEFIKENNLKIKQLEWQLDNAHTENKDLKSRLEEQKSDLIFANEKAERYIVKKNTVTEKLLASDAYAIVHYRLEQNRTLKDKEWDNVDSSINDIVENFKTCLYSIYRMSEQEYRICMLLRLGFSATEMSVLLSRSMSAISLARKRLYKKMFGKDGNASELDEFVKSL